MNILTKIINMKVISMENQNKSDFNKTENKKYLDQLKTYEIFTTHEELIKFVETIPIDEELKKYLENLNTTEIIDKNDRLNKQQTLRNLNIKNKQDMVKKNLKDFIVFTKIIKSILGIKIADNIIYPYQKYPLCCLQQINTLIIIKKEIKNNNQQQLDNQTIKKIEETYKTIQKEEITTNYINDILSLSSNLMKQIAYIKSLVEQNIEEKDKKIEEQEDKKIQGQMIKKPEELIEEKDKKINEPIEQEYCNMCTFI